MKKVTAVYDPPRQHWVGDGFPVRTLFSYSSHEKTLSPFILFDRAGPHEFAPSQEQRGVGQHPHRGFETVTIIYEGELAHRDSNGQGGVIGAGDVQWMTAASGILHDEFHTPAFSQSGGTLDLVQLWVNLPARAKMSPPRYQAILDATIPAVPLADKAGLLRVIAGNYAGQAGPAYTVTPMQVWDVRLNAGASVELPAANGWNTAVVVLHGSVQVNGAHAEGNAQLVLLERSGNGLHLQAETDAVVLVLSGEPIDEPVSGHGPFVMNTREEIVQAVHDFNNGLFGRMPD